MMRESRMQLPEGTAMLLIELVHLAEGVLKQQGQDNQNNTTQAGKTQAQAAAQRTGRIDRDEFRHSNGTTGNEAGLFEVKQQSVFTAAAAVLLVQGGARRDQNAQAQTTANTQATQTSTNPQAGGTNTVNAIAAGAAANASNPTTTDDVQVLSQLSSLNAALVALGLSQDEINVIDRVAQLIKNFSPSAFTSLVDQLQVLAQNGGQSATNAAPSTITGPSTNTGPSNPASTATTAQNNTLPTTQNGGFTIESLSIKFAGVNETLQQNDKNSNGDTLQVSAFQLQVSEVKLTLNNRGTGQSAQIQAPQAQAGANPPLTKKATA